MINSTIDFHVYIYFHFHPSDDKLGHQEANNRGKYGNNNEDNDKTIISEDYGSDGNEYDDNYSRSNSNDENSKVAMIREAVMIMILTKAKVKVSIIMVIIIIKC